MLAEHYYNVQRFTVGIVLDSMVNLHVHIKHWLVCMFPLNCVSFLFDRVGRGLNPSAVNEYVNFACPCACIPLFIWVGTSVLLTFACKHQHVKHKC